MIHAPPLGMAESPDRPFPLPTALLVAVDFSPSSLRALDAALSWRRPEADVTVLHVVDSGLARHLQELGICSSAQAIETLRSRADARFGELADRDAFDTMVVEGDPFAEIIRIANDLDCDLIVLGSRSATPGLGELLFGSTAEKVLRGARQPVLCVP